MADDYFSLSEQDRSDALEVGAAHTGRPVHLLEKDIWVVWVLSVLFRSELAEHLTFKGGTSLSKAYKIIDRFSEDVDLTVDIRSLIGDLVVEPLSPIPSSRSQAQRWHKAIKSRLPAWLNGQVLPFLQDNIKLHPVPAEVSLRGDQILVDYEPLRKGTGYVSPTVRLEFGARSTGEPHTVRPVVCYMGEGLPELSFPQASPRVMRAERTFWEKVTLAHVYCKQGNLKADRFSRHWHDIAAYASTEYLELALSSKEVALEVVRHKSVFFREKGVDYNDAVSGKLLLVPAEKPYDDLAGDYEKMIEDGILLQAGPSFEAIVATVGRIAESVNAIAWRP